MKVNILFIITVNLLICYVSAASDRRELNKQLNECRQEEQTK